MTFTHNIRFGVQYDTIKNNVTIEGASIIDFGCGYADIIRHALLDGAEFVVGVEKDQNIISEVIRRFPRAAIDPNIVIVRDDAESYIMANKKIFDIGMCFSVLPYLKDPYRFLYNLKNKCKVALIECQYQGDAPDLPLFWPKDDNDMEEWLSEHWDDVQPIGHTMVEYRGTKRTIWLCQ